MILEQQQQEQEQEHQDIDKHAIDWYEVSELLTDSNASTEELLSRVANLAVGRSKSCSRILSNHNKIYYSDNFTAEQLSFPLIFEIDNGFGRIEVFPHGPNFCVKKKEVEKLAALVGRVLYQNQERETLELFYQESDDLLCVLESQVFKKVNQAFTTSVLGWSESDLLEQPFRSFLHPQDDGRKLSPAKFQQQYQQEPEEEEDKSATTATTVGTSASDAEACKLRFLCKDGSYATVTWSCIDGTSLWVGRVEETVNTSKLARVLPESLQLSTLGKWDIANSKISDMTCRLFQIDPKSVGATCEAFLSVIQG